MARGAGAQQHGRHWYEYKRQYQHQHKEVQVQLQYHKRGKGNTVGINCMELTTTARAVRGRAVSGERGVVSGRAPYAVETLASLGVPRDEAPSHRRGGYSLTPAPDGGRL